MQFLYHSNIKYKKKDVFLFICMFNAILAVGYSMHRLTLMYIKELAFSVKIKCSKYSNFITFFII